MTSALSVGIFTYSSRPRGSVVHAASLAEALSAAGHDVTLYALCKHGDGFFRRVRCALRLLPAGAAPATADELIRQRIAEFRAGIDALAPKHDIWHAEDCLAANALLAVEHGERPGPVVRTVHHVERFESEYLEACQKRSIEQADAVFSVSELTRGEVLAEYGRRAALIFNGVDTSRFVRRRPELEGFLRARFAVPSHAQVVLSVGGVEPRKNSLRALGAMAQVLAKKPDLYWIVAGGASIWTHESYRASFEAQLSELPTERRQRVIRVGQLEDDELTSLFQLSDALFCPSEQEGFGLSVLEAMAAGKPVVVSDRAPFTEYLDHQSAVLVDPGSVEEMVDGLETVLADEGPSARLVANALERVSRFSWRRSAAGHVEQYRSLLSSQS